MGRDVRSGALSTLAVPAHHQDLASRARDGLRNLEADPRVRARHDDGRPFEVHIEVARTKGTGVTLEAGCVEAPEDTGVEQRVEEAQSAASIAAFSASLSGPVIERQRSITRPSRPTRNFSKFHFTSEPSPAGLFTSHV